MWLHRASTPPRLAARYISENWLILSLTESTGLPTRWSCFLFIIARYSLTLMRPAMNLLSPATIRGRRGASAADAGPLTWLDGPSSSTTLPVFGRAVAGTVSAASGGSDGGAAVALAAGGAGGGTHLPDEERTPDMLGSAAAASARGWS